MTGFPSCSFSGCPHVTRRQPRQAEQVETLGPGQVPLWGLYWLTGAATEKYCRPGALKNSSLVPHESGNYRAEIKMLAALVSLETSLLGV